MHLTDTLEIGGAERMAVNIVNLLPRDRFMPHLCATRRLGPLADLIAPDVPQLCLDRRHRLDLRAVRRLVAYIREHEIGVLHAHGTAVFAAVAASMFAPHPAVIWHIHFGRYASDQHPGWIYRAIADRVSHAISVNEPLADWAVTRLGLPSRRVSYIPNFSTNGASRRDGCDSGLPGTVGERIVCVANFLPEKDHATLLRAMVVVARTRPTAHLLLVGGSGHAQLERRIRAQIEKLGLARHVTLLGQRRDVPAILGGVDIGVLTSTAEGLPLALIEYGSSAIPAVVTRVGQCADVVDHGRAGLLVSPGSPAEVAAALLELLASRERREELGRKLKARVQARYDATRIVERMCDIYVRTAPR